MPAAIGPLLCERCGALTYWACERCGTLCKPCHVDAERKMAALLGITETVLERLRAERFFPLGAAEPGDR